jgi:predicted nucleotidyltransferase
MDPISSTLAALVRLILVTKEHMALPAESTEGRTNSLWTLERRLGAKWDSLHTVAAQTAEVRQKLETGLSEFSSEDTTVVVFGSLARGEYTAGSDIDWVLLVDGIANPEHLTSSLEIREWLLKNKYKQPGREGTFGGLVFAGDLIHRIGGEDDTNANTTVRLLSLLESTAIGQSVAYDRVNHNVLRRYVMEDYGWVHARNLKNLPRFLLNDIVRFWRTMAVDFAYKRRERGAEEWALKTAKLRLSRKLIYVSGLLMCYSCAIDPTIAQATPSEDNSELALATIDHLSGRVKQTPLELISSVLLNYEQLDGASTRLFGAYDNFVGLLNSSEDREHLKKLPQEDVATDEVYERVRNLSHDFQGALTDIFLENNGTELYDLTKIYGVF